MTCGGNFAKYQTKLQKKRLFSIILSNEATAYNPTRAIFLQKSQKNYDKHFWKMP